MSALAVYELPVIGFGPMIREDARRAELLVKNKRYRRSPVGAAVGRYIRGLEYAGYSKATIESYEQPLAWLAVSHDDFASLARFCEEGGPEYLEDFLIDKWGSSSEKTRAHRRTVLNVFFDWAKEKGLVPFNPMTGIKGPRAPKTLRERVAYEQTLVRRLIDAQPGLRDRCALGLLRLAIRKNDLRMLQLRDIDLARDVLRLNHAKGGERHRIPILFTDLRGDLSAHLWERGLETGRDAGDEYLIYARERRTEPMNPASVHRWFKRCLERAELPSSIQMHELRHTAGDHVWRQTGNIVIAQKLLRHKNPGTTATYLHPTEDDLRAGLRIVEESDRA